MAVELRREGDEVRLPGMAGQLDLGGTLDCGQAFRWRQREDGSWEGAAGTRYLRLRREGEDILLAGAGEEDLPFWRAYLDLDRDYGELERVFRRNPVLRRALELCPGIRVLRQEPWETLCTFILSANNNIPRIKGLVERLCRGWGEEIPGTGWWAFPRAEVLAALGPEDLAPVRAGWRSGYLLDAARRVAEGRLDLTELEKLPTPAARERLLEVRGVGPKVADCVLLFGFGRVECVPMDVWMKRVMESCYPRGLPGYLRPWGGIAQQFLFQAARKGRQGLL